MKTILVDAIHALVTSKGELFQAMIDLLDQYPNPKIVLTGANDEQFQKFRLDRVPYPVFTLKHNPEKSDPSYFRKMLEHFGLAPADVVYFEHNLEAAESARSVGITTYHYESEKNDLAALKTFIDQSL